MRSRLRSAHHVTAVPADTLELLTIPTLAAELGVSVHTLHRRSHRLPRPIRLGRRRLFLRSEVAHLLREDHGDDDLVDGSHLAALLHCSVRQLYLLVKQGTVPQPHHGDDGRSLWSRQAVARHLAALPR